MIKRFAFVLLSSMLCHAAFAGTNTFECIYETYSDEEGNHKAKDNFAISFLVEPAAKKAYMLGSLGSTEVELIPNTSGLTFVEVTGTGNVMVTAINDDGRSVHSRSGMVLGKIVPSQY
jgi:hypothetical protein